MKLYYLLFLLLPVVFFACKKVDNELADQEAMPSVNTSEVTLYEPGGINGITAIYPKEVVVGDTITLAGRLKLDQGATMTLGNAQAKFLFTAQREYKDYASGTITLMDVVRFVVTPEMGGGPQPLVIRNGAYVRTAPDITIHTIPVIASHTDTTLVVRSILNNAIAGFDTRYQNLSGDLFKGWSVSDNGECWLQTDIDIYRIRNGQMESFLKSGDILTINGQPVALTGFNGVSVNKANTTLYLSVDTKDPANSLAGRYYLLKMDIATRQVTTVLNSTWYQRRDATSAQLVTVSPAQFINSGMAMDIPIKAFHLQVDVQGRLLFVNNIQVYLPNSYKDITNLSRINETGRLVTLLEGKANSDKLKYTTLFDVSDDGRYAWFAPSGGGLMYYDLELEELIAKADATQNLFNVSYEQNPDYKFTTLLKPFNGVSGTTYCAMSNGELLQSYGASLAAIDLKDGALYAFAGLEKGVNYTGTLVVQSNTDGQARYVSFTGINLLGVDAQGNVYFMRDGKVSGTTVKPPKIYVLGK